MIIAQRSVIKDEHKTIFQIKAEITGESWLSNEELTDFDLDIDLEAPELFNRLAPKFKKLIYGTIEKELNDLKSQLVSIRCENKEQLLKKIESIKSQLTIQYEPIQTERE